MTERFNLEEAVVILGALNEMVTPALNESISHDAFFVACEHLTAKAMELIDAYLAADLMQRGAG